MTEVYRVDVEVTAPVHPTEVSDRVADAITSLFPGAEVEWAYEPDADGAAQRGELVGRTHSLDRFAERLREQEILDTAREQLRAGKRGERVSFALKKQAAHEGVVNFAVGEPDELGELHVSVRVHEPSVDAFVDRLAPPTESGVPVEDPWQ